MNKSARLYNCAHCHVQVVICSDCDRGNIYCNLGCSKKSRIRNHRVANQKYQKSFKGRQKHAERQQRYRQRQKEKNKKVTDQGSPILSPNDLLQPKPNENKKPICCHFCGKEVLPFLRIGYLHQQGSTSTDCSQSWPLGP